jgi:hypothetical protein
MAQNGKFFFPSQQRFLFRQIALVKTDILYFITFHTDKMMVVTTGRELEILFPILQGETLHYTHLFESFKFTIHCRLVD